MLPVILVAVGAYLIGDSVLSDKKYAKGGELDAESAKKRLEELRKELRAERISYSELAELESLKKYIDDDDVELRQAAGIPEFEDEDDDEDDDDDKYAKGGEAKKGMMANNSFLYPSVFYEGQSILFKPTNNSKLDKAVRNLNNKYANKELVIDKITIDKPYNTAKVFDRNTGEKLPFDIILNPRYVEQYAKGGKTNGDMTDADKAMKEGYVQQVVEIATKANENGIKASDLTYEEFSDKVFEATSTSYGKVYLRGAYEIMTKKGYAEGGMMDEVNTEVIAVKGNIMGTTTLDLKIKGMRKPQDFIVYPISNEQAGKPITIQSDTRFGYLDLSSGRGLMSQSHANGAYSYHFAADKKVPFKISETDVERIKEHLASKASSKAGNSVIFSDNSGADKMAGGGLVVNSDEDLREVAKYMAKAVKKRADLKDLVYYFEKDNNYDYKYRVKIWDEMNVYEMKKTEDNIYKVLKAIKEANEAKK